MCESVFKSGCVYQAHPQEPSQCEQKLLAIANGWRVDNAELRKRLQQAVESEEMLEAEKATNLASTQAAILKVKVHFISLPVLQGTKQDMHSLTSQASSSLKCLAGESRKIGSQ